MYNISFSNIDELCEKIKNHKDIFLFLDTNIISSYYDDKDLNHKNVQKLINQSENRCFITPSVMKECIKFKPGPEFNLVKSDEKFYEGRLDTGWRYLQESLKIGEKFKTDVMILFEASSLPPYIKGHDNISIPNAFFITQNMKFLKRCLISLDNRKLIQQAISQSGLENLVCAYGLDCDKLTPFVQIGGGASLDEVL
jgi:predicted nucleic acid-binding protein